MKNINILLGNIFLPLVWMACTGVFSVANFAVGFVLSSASLWIITSPGEVTFIVYASRALRLVGLLLFFSKELFVANMRVAFEVLTVRHRMTPAILAIPLDLKSDLEITVLANMITLTPGTLSLDVSPSRSMLYVHAMYVTDVDAFRRDIKERYERRVREVFR